MNFFFLAIPLLGLRVSPFTLWVPTLHTEGLQQSEVSSVQPASLRLRWVYVSAISVCFRTPRLSLGHPGSLTSVHDLKCMRTQTASLFYVPRGKRFDVVLFCFILQRCFHVGEEGAVVFCFDLFISHLKLFEIYISAPDPPPPDIQERGARKEGPDLGLQATPAHAYGVSGRKVIIFVIIFPFLFLLLCFCRFLGGERGPYVL